MWHHVAKVVLLLLPVVRVDTRKVAEEEPRNGLGHVRAQLGWVKRYDVIRPHCVQLANLVVEGSRIFEACTACTAELVFGCDAVALVFYAVACHVGVCSGDQRCQAGQVRSCVCLDPPVRF